MKYTVESLREFGIQVAEKVGMSHKDAETLLKTCCSATCGVSAPTG